MVNRMRSNKSHTGNRRSHHSIKMTGIAVDKQTGMPHLRHRVSLVTGQYRGRQVIDVVKKLEKKQAKAKANQEAAK